MEHVPAATSATEAPETVQTAGVVEAKLTASPELAVALTVNAALFTCRLLRAAKLIVCAAGFTAKLRLTVGAGPNIPFPAWLAVIEHVPPPTMVTTPPETAQTLDVVEVKLTAKPELAVALIVNGAAPKT